ncbi:MAG: MCE family protein, partial [Thermocrispum sp.]
FTDVTSLNPGDDIRMAGVRIGQVTDVSVAGRHDAEVEFTVDARRKIFSTTTAAVKFRNLIGQRYIALEHGPGTGPQLPVGGTIPLERTRPALDLTALFNGFKPLFQALTPKQVNQLSYEIVQVLQGEGGTVDSILQHTATLTSSLANKDDVIGRVVGNLNEVLDAMNSRGDELGRLIATTRKLVSGLAADAEPIGDAVEGLAALSTSTADLLKQGREPLRKSIEALGPLAKTLADNSPVFERFIANLPRKYNDIGRIASYGSWMNFYLCAVDSDAPPAPGGGPVGVPLVDRRCKG